MLKDLELLLNELEEGISLKNKVLNFFAAIFLALFIVSPLVAIGINLFEIYYEYQLLLTIGFGICAMIFSVLYTKFYLDIYTHKKEVVNKKGIKYLYICHLFMALLFAIAGLIGYLIAR